MNTAEVMDAMTDVDHATLCAMVSYVKLRGSSMIVKGHTAPEGHPYAVVVMVAKPGGGEALFPVLSELEAKLRELSPIIEAREEAPWP